VPPIFNGMATAARLDERGLVHFHGRPHLIFGLSRRYYLMGWTGGYVLLALLLAPYLA
jgi:cation/acetate symporter